MHVGILLLLHMLAFRAIGQNARHHHQASPRIQVQGKGQSRIQATGPALVSLSSKMALLSNSWEYTVMVLTSDIHDCTCRWPSSAPTHEVSLAVAKVAPNSWWNYAVALFANRSSFTDIPTKDLSPSQLREKVADFGLESGTLTADEVNAVKQLVTLKEGGGLAITDDLKYCRKLHDEMDVNSFTDQVSLQSKSHARTLFTSRQPSFGTV
jgi:hypothetical protein